jgi:peptidoglycan/LPS O-acetylase OafA/YrhL
VAGSPSVTLALRGNDNALNFLRLVLAAGVVVGHAWPFATGVDGPMPGGMSIGVWCVAGFFGISGYLVSGSRVRLGLTDYLVRRSMRIFPAFWACLLVTAAIFAPLSAVFHDGSVRSLDPSSAASYLARNLGLWIFQRDIDHTLTDVQIPGEWNGSLWTLSYEFAAYLALGLLFTAVRSKRSRRLVCVALLALLVTANMLVEVHGAETNAVTLGVWLAAAFTTGVVIRILSVPWTPALAVLAAALLVLAGVLELPRTLGAPAIAYAVLWLGARLPLRVGKENDVSYGIYIYAFPVSQLLASSEHSSRLGVFWQAVLTLVLCTPLAWASWLLVERPALSRHRWVTQRLLTRRRAAPNALR